MEKEFFDWVKRIYKEKYFVLVIMFAIYGLINILFKVVQPFKKFILLFFNSNVYSNLNAFATKNVFITSVVTSLISAVIFYLIFEWIPLKIKNRKVLPYVAKILYDIQITMMFEFQEILITNNNSNFPSIQHDISVGKVTENIISEGLKNSYFNSNAIDPKDTNAKIIGEKLYIHIITIERKCHEVLNYSQFLDATTIEFVNNIIGVVHHESFKNRYNQPSFIASLLVNSPMDGMSESFYDEYQLYLEFKKYLIEKYSWCSIDILKIYEIDLIKEDNYKSCIKVCKKAIKLRTKQKSCYARKDAFERANIFYCLYYTNKIKSYKYLKTSLERKLISVEDLKNRDEYTDISIDENIMNIIVGVQSTKPT